MILDHRGRPIHPKTLHAEQAAQSRARSYAMLLPQPAQTPERIASILRQAAMGDLYALSLLYSDMEEKDTHIYAEITKRRGAVAGLDWHIYPWDDSTQQRDMAASIQSVLEGLSAPNLFYALTDGIGKGFAAVELIWDTTQRGDFAPVRAIQRPMGWFQWRTTDGYMPTDEIGLTDLSLNAEPLTPGKWIVYMHPSGSGNPFRTGCYRSLAWLYLYRNYALKSWTQFIEIFGIPFRVGKFPVGTGTSEKEALLDALEGMFGDSVVAIPDTTSIELISQTIGSGSDSAHKAFMDWSAREISKVVLGSTLTSQTDQIGSYAMAKVHNEVRIDMLEQDAKAVAAVINRDLVRPYIALNLGEQAHYPYLAFTIPQEDRRETTAKILESLSRVGFTDIPVWWLHEQFGVPSPEEGDLTLREMTPSLNTMRPMTRHGLSLQSIQREPSHSDQELDTMLIPVMNAIEKATDFDEIADRLYDLYPDMDVEKFQRLIGRAMFAAGLWGATS